MPNIKWAWNDKFPPLNLWNYPMNFPTDLQERIHEDALLAKQQAISKQQWMQNQYSARQTTSVSNANAIQEGGNHYKHKAIQPWDYIAGNGMGFLEGSIIKYVSRYQDKNGIEDLKKARHFLDKLIEVKSASK